MHSTWGKGAGGQGGDWHHCQRSPAQLALDLEGGAEGPRTQRIHSLLKKKKKNHFFYWSVLVGVCYKTGPMEWEGRGPPCKMPALGPAHTEPCGGLSSPLGGRQGHTVAQREEVSGALFLGNGKGLLHLDLATVCDRHVLQRLVPTVSLGALYLPYYILGRKAVSGLPRQGHRSQRAAGRAETHT